MIRNYLKIALRSLVRSKVHSFINVSGLALGMACCLLIVLFVRDELTFDRFHKNADRIYRAYAKEDYGEGQQFFDVNTPFPLGPALRDNLSEVEYMVRINNITPQVRVNDQLFTSPVMVAGVDFLNMFDFGMVNGDRGSALQQQSSVMITESMARKFFGDGAVLGKGISIMINDRFEEFTVSAVLKDPPPNSSITFSLIISDLNYPRLYSERTLHAWFNISPETYIMLREGSDVKNVSARFPSIFKPLLGDDYERSHYFVGLQPLTSIHLDTSFPPAIAPVSDPKYSYILSAIASLILIVACINFVTLSIGRSIKRAKEVGVRKVAGAQRRELIVQFIGEAVIITCLALVVGVVLAWSSMPVFNDLAGKQLVFSFDGFMIGVLAALIGIIGLIAGSYPAFILSSFRPVTVLKGAMQTGNNKQRLRKVLVGIQLTLSVFLISSTLLMKEQLQYLQSRNLGFDREQLAVMQLNVRGGRLSERVVAGLEKAAQFKSELARIPQVAAVTVSSHDFGHGSWLNIGYTDDQGTYRTFFYNTVDADFIPVMKMELASGRNFSEENPSDLKRSIIVNEAFVKEYGWKDALGKRIPGRKFEDHEIIGVVKDFNFTSLYTKVEPMVMALDPKVMFSGIENIGVDNTPIPKLFVKLKPGNASSALEEIRNVWNKLTGGEEFIFSFVDQAIDAQYRNDRNLGKIVSIATLIAMIIGSLGLYGLASLAMQNRTKEISIRKVLGATENSLLLLLSREYVYLVLASLTISIPVTIYLMTGWLSTFEYHVSIGPGLFLISGGISLAIALLTISYQAIRTAWSQPAQTLKYE